MDKSDYGRAVQDYDRAIRLSPKYAFAYGERGKARLAVGDYKGAVFDFDQAICLGSKTYLNYANRGSAKANLQDLPGAIRDYDEAMRLNSTGTFALRKRAFAKFKLKDYRGAISDYDEAVKIAPDTTVFFAGRGMAKSQLKDYQGAIEDYRQAIQIDPNDPLLHDTLAWQLATCEDPQGRDAAVALSHAKIACELSEWKDDHKIETLAAAYAASGDFSKAIEYLEKAIEINPSASQNHRKKMMQSFRDGTPFRS